MEAPPGGREGTLERVQFKEFMGFLYRFRTGKGKAKKAKRTVLGVRRKGRMTGR